MHFGRKILLLFIVKNARFAKQDVFINRQQIGGEKCTHLAGANTLDTALHRRILFLCELLLIKIFR
jgi:hypothetical protein